MRDFRDISLFKKLMFIILSVLILAGMVIVLADIDFNVSEDVARWLNNEMISYVVLCLSLLMSLIFLRLNKKSILLTISLIAIIVGASFNVFVPFEGNANNEAILYCLCAFQGAILIYTVWLDRGTGLKILDLAIRVALSLIAFFLLPEYLPDYFDITNTIFVIYLINSLVSLFTLAFHFKTNYLLWCGLLLVLAGTIFYMFMYGGLELFGIASGGFASFLNSFDIAFLCTGLGVYLIATSATFSSNMLTKPSQNM